MNILLAIHTYAGANDTVIRHRQFYEKAGANMIVTIGTNDNECLPLEGIPQLNIGRNSYMNGDHLPRRLADTMEWMLGTGYTHFCIAEYDTLFFKPIPDFTGVAAHLAGGQTFDAKADRFYHNPWFFTVPFGTTILREMRRIIQEGHCEYGKAESSPDVFFAYACQRAGIEVKTDLMSEYSRNDLKDPAHLMEARQAFRNGVDILHGCKTKEELEFITRL